MGRNGKIYPGSAPLAGHSCGGALFGGNNERTIPPSLLKIDPEE